MLCILCIYRCLHIYKVYKYVSTYYIYLHTKYIHILYQRHIIRTHLTDRQTYV